MGLGVSSRGARAAPQATPRVAFANDKAYRAIRLVDSEQGTAFELTIPVADEPLA